MSQFPCPITTVCTQNMKLTDGTSQALIRKEFKFIFPARRTGFVLILESFTACAAEVGAATTSQVWVSEYQAAYRTFCLKNTRRWLNKCAIIASKRLLPLWSAIMLCSTLSSSRCDGGWSFLLLSTFCLLCMYIQYIITLIRFIAVMYVWVNYYSIRLPLLL